GRDRRERARTRSPTNRLPPRESASAGSCHEVDRDRDAVEAEALAQPVLDPVAVIACHEAGIVDGEAKARRAHPDLRAVEEVEPAAARPARRLARLTQLGE